MHSCVVAVRLYADSPTLPNSWYPRPPQPAWKKRGAVHILQGRSTGRQPEHAWRDVRQHAQQQRAEPTPASACSTSAIGGSVSAAWLWLVLCRAQRASEDVQRACGASGNEMSAKLGVDNSRFGAASASASNRREAACTDSVLQPLSSSGGMTACAGAMATSRCAACGARRQRAGTARAPDRVAHRASAVTTRTNDASVNAASRSWRPARNARAAPARAGRVTCCCWLRHLMDMFACIQCHNTLGHTPSLGPRASLRYTTAFDNAPRFGRRCVCGDFSCSCPQVAYLVLNAAENAGEILDKPCADKPP
jgi:hypothetical protein